MPSSRLAALLGVAAVTAVMAAVAVAGPERNAPTARTSSHVASLALLFSDNVFLGGQVAPRQYRWANRDASLFVQFDRPPPEAKALRYIGIGVRGTFCAETQQRGANGGFTHFHRLTAPVYAQGHGGPPGAEGYWLMWAAADEFQTSDGRLVKPGVDYQFSPTPPPPCGARPQPGFQGPGAAALTRSQIRRLARFFHDQPLTGGQSAPRLYRWVNGDVAVFLQFDRADPRRATRLRHFGIAKRGRFTCADQGTPDFSHFQRQKAPTYRRGSGGRTGAIGLWHLAIRVDRNQGVDRRFEPTPPTDCPKP
jgi:hypothetical protein